MIGSGSVEDWSDIDVIRRKIAAELDHCFEIRGLKNVVAADLLRSS